MILMNIIFKICPCLTWVLNPRPTSAAKKYDGVNELEEQEFMHHIENEAMKIDSKNETIDESSLEEHLNVELGLKNTEPVEEYFKEASFSDSQGPDSNVSKEELIDLTQEAKTTFRLNIPEYDEYYEAIHGASKAIPQLLSADQYPEINLPREGNEKSELRAWGKTNARGGTFILDYQLPCSYSFYEDYCNRKITAKDGKVIQEYRQVDSLKPNLNVKFLCLNKISMLEPRSFTYLKYTNGGEGEHWQVCISKDEFHPPEVKAKLGRMHLVSRIGESEGGIRVRSYVQVDLNGSMIENMWGKIHLEVGRYVEEMWREVSENYQEELV